jgi:long-chain acyl-CoA synthetase
VTALVVPDGEFAPSAAELRDHVAARLAGYKVPKVFELVTRLPRTPSGKLLRRELT